MIQIYTIYTRRWHSIWSAVATLSPEIYILIKKKITFWDAILFIRLVYNMYCITQNYTNLHNLYKEPALELVCWSKPFS